MYNGDCEVYIIRYFNVWFYLFAKTETDNYKIKMLGEHISAGNSMKMKDIHWWCTRHSTRWNLNTEKSIQFELIYGIFIHTVDLSWQCLIPIVEEWAQNKT